MQRVDMALMKLGMDLMNPPEDVATVNEYRQYIQKVITMFTVPGAVTTTAGRPKDPMVSFLKKVAESPERYILYDGDIKELGPIYRSSDQSDLEEDELRLSNGAVLVFPGPVSENPTGMICVREVDE